MRRRLWTFMLAVGALSALPCVQVWAQDTPAEATADEDQPLDGFWPTRTMVRLFLDRMLDDSAEHYGLDETQMELVRETLNKRIPDFLARNRRKLQPVLNRFIEAQLLDEAPDADDVAQWSQNALPMLGELTDVMRLVTDDMREFLSDEQINKLDAESAAFEAGVTLVSNKLSVWAQGGYDPETDWVPDVVRRKRRERESREQAEAQLATGGTAAAGATTSSTRPASSASQPAIPKDEWVQYVEEFIELYRLDAEQKQKAHAYLITQIQARDRYLQLRGKDIEKATLALDEAKIAEEIAKAQAAYERLNAPLERMFERLKKKLDTVPNRQQIARAEARLAAQRTPSGVTSRPVAERP